MINLVLFLVFFCIYIHPSQENEFRPIEANNIEWDQIVVRYSCVDGNRWIAEDWRGKGKTHSIKGEEYFF